jgi:hemolysin activation/secretion protein
VEETGPLQFVLTGVAIEGATIFTPAQLIPLYEEFVLERISAADVTEILKRITDLYRDSGYLLSRAIAPPQDLQSGVLRIVVIEGHVERVVFAGDAADGGSLEAYARPVTSERPLRARTLERAILLIEDLPGLSVAPSLRAINETKGVYELILEIRTDAVEGFWSLDNRGTDGLGPLESWSGVNLNNLANLRERLRASLFVVPNDPHELTYADFAWEQPIGSDGFIISAFGYVSRVNESLDGLPDPHSRAHQVALRGGYPIIRSRDRNLWVRAGLEMTNLSQRFVGFEILRDRLRVARVRLDFDAEDDLGGVTFATVEVSQGFNAFGASHEGEALLSRADGRPDFTKFNLSVTRHQEVFDAVSVQLDFAAQKSLNPLLSPEEFALGGPRFGRAYNFAELKGDDGLGVSVEARWAREVGEGFLHALQAYVFYDFGAVWNRNAFPERMDTLSSAGAGVRLLILPGLRFDIELAKPLERVPFGVNDRGVRTFFLMSADF